MSIKITVIVPSKDPLTVGDDTVIKVKSLSMEGAIEELNAAGLSVLPIQSDQKEQTA